MSRVEDRLSAIAEMVANELVSDPVEVNLWKELVKSVDLRLLAQTGEIVVREGVLERAGADGVDDARANEVDEGLHYDPGQVRAALERLRRRSRRAQVDRTPRVQRLVRVPDLDEPNYDSEETELWLYGPLS